ncbi:MAG: NAD-dependent epimerase/dehydratase family protein [Halieaceae bacterium]|jgi:UDP-glucose 4-epimerase|nr:NAD-dependent epimerase/dehydratase family protein [Halieaceae bacterium]
MLGLTGATGYIGRALLPALQSAGCTVTTVGRRPVGADIPHRQLDLRSAAGYRDALVDMQSLIHCAGVAHNLGGASDYELVNRRATVSLADAALSTGCQHFVFISSLNVVSAGAMDAEAPARRLPRPNDHYARSKWETEQQLEALLAGSDTRLTIIRPALVYDRELVANLAVLERWLSRIPVTLPAVGRRCMVSRPDLVAEIVGSLGTEAGSLRRIAVTDGECYDLKRIGRVLGGGLKVGVPVPALVLKLVSALRDRWSGLPGGTTWTGLAGDKWCARGSRDLPITPRLTLEQCLSQSPGDS